MQGSFRNNGRCDGVTRRDFVRVGGLTAFGLGLADLVRVRDSVTANELTPRKTRSCILIWLDGGPSHLETFDLKPDAPSEVRGPFQPISTAVAGTQICELLPRTAQMLDRIAIIRSMTSPLGEHNFGAQYMLSGYKPGPVIDYPSFGSVVAQLHDERGILPNNIAVPSFRVGGGRLSGQGFLPEQTRPFSVGGDPAKPDFQVRDLDLYAEINPNRLDRRRSFLNAFDRFHRGVESSTEQSDESTDPANVSGGRDHWPRVFSVAMAGGGVVGGQVLGSSDSVGEGPKDRPVTPADLACTIYSLLGIDPKRLLHAPDGRPIQVNRDGQRIHELVS